MQAALSGSYPAMDAVADRVALLTDSLAWPPGVASSKQACTLDSCANQSIGLGSLTVLAPSKRGKSQHHARSC